MSSGIPEAFQNRIRSGLEKIELGADRIASLTRDELYGRVFAATQGTPTEIISLENGNTLLIRDETVHPFSASHYDRIFAQLIEEPEKKGKISPEKTILTDPSSGNSGISMGSIGQVLGYTTRVYVPKSLPSNRRELNCLFNKENREIEDEDEFMERVSAKMMADWRESRRNEGKTLRPLNHSHSETTVKAFGEIYREMPKDIRHVDYWISPLGNGSHTYGVAQAIAQENPNVRVIGVESSVRCPVFTGHTNHFQRHKLPEIDSFRGEKQGDAHGFRGDMPGVGVYGIKFPFVDKLIQEGLLRDITLLDPQKTKENLAKFNNTGRPLHLQYGHTSVNAEWAARELSKHVKDKTILILRYDTLEKY